MSDVFDRYGFRRVDNVSGTETVKGAEPGLPGADPGNSSARAAGLRHGREEGTALLGAEVHALALAVVELHGAEQDAWL